MITQKAHSGIHRETVELASCAVDVSLLTKGFPMISGWFHLNSSSNSSFLLGQVHLKVQPSTPLGPVANPFPITDPTSLSWNAFQDYVATESTGSPLSSTVLKKENDREESTSQLENIIQQLSALNQRMTQTMTT